ncbi:glycogen debranching enzyme [Histoplasma capsulatum var. duboisii H88]|uniref:Glycogen debranching enzyme n=1 Tax=Ajellomyces capsulatus (strain H88) TaxID=544711 RepID=F0UTC9_AJEC8|nr:glycogen debranching enzyme [Histoplasma capsulatum var. duboisii H88]
MASQKREVYLLPLTDNGSPDVPREFISLPPPTDPPYILRFVTEGSSPICRRGSLWANIPKEGKQFEKDELTVDAGNDNNKENNLRLIHSSTQATEIDIPITAPGAFAFYVTYAAPPSLSASSSLIPREKSQEQLRSQTHYLTISPRVKLNDTRLPFTSLSVITVLSKFMGQYPTDWDKHLASISRRGYNMVHFTPLMARGESNSPYSIFDPLTFDPACFPNGEADVAALVKRMEGTYGLLALTDVVWNHTANNASWLLEHPEAGYSVATAPWLEAALELDTALLRYSEQLAELGLPVDFKSNEDVVEVVNGIKGNVIDKIRLWEYYAVDVQRDVERTIQAYVSDYVRIPEGGFGVDTIGPLQEIRNWSLKEKASFIRERGLNNNSRILGRHSRDVDAAVGAALLRALYGRYEKESSDISQIRIELVKILDEVNLPLFLEFDRDSQEIFDQVFNRVKYQRLDDNGPKLGPITEENPLVETYFTRLPVNGVTKNHDPNSLALINNGWVWNADAMRDTAGADSRAYLRREVVAWGDCVKLRYGACPDDNPFLWDYMARYTRLMAKHFAGFRIDNCHSTPLVVAEYLLNEARRVRPDLTVFAELFTGSEETDYLFTKRLGLSALIREAMQAWNATELSRLVHRHGGRPIGSFDIDLLTGDYVRENSPDHTNGGDRNEAIKHIREMPIQVLFMDCTHDNEVPAQKRQARDTLPNAALVAMCASASGSVMGYDEIYPKNLDLVKETRVYSSRFSEEEEGQGTQMGVKGNMIATVGEEGIGCAKKLLNQLHMTMAVDGYDETHIHHVGEYITVHRVQPNTRKGIFLIAHTAFSNSGNSNATLDPVCLTRTDAKLLSAWKLEVDDSDASKERVLSDKKYLRGLPSRILSLDGVRVDGKGNETVITIPGEFPPGSIAVFETWIPGEDPSENLRSFIISGADEAFGNLDLIDLNFVLYRCDAEERDSSGGKDGVYNIPNFAPLDYAGLQGWWSVLEPIVHSNDLGHPVCDNIRSGQWAFDFIVGRMKNAVEVYGYDHLQVPATWLQERFDAIRSVPDFLLPRYFAMIVQTAYYAARKRGISLLDGVRYGTHFIHSLAMVAVQMVGYVKSASLYPDKQVPALAAGLPHFATDWARCWGRDVFISLRGLLLVTGRFDVAKAHILAFASVLKHGMIPNLLGSGKLPRYNSRDSVWFFLQAIQDYTTIVPDGISLLDVKVPRRFLPYDDIWFPFDDQRAYSQSSTIAEIIQEVFQRHASGLSFREYNAGPDLDRQMNSEGFQIDVHVDWKTGFIFGGNQWNCGTWMDKMGESEKAGNKGYPGTPRDGAAVEITGLLYSALRWVAKLHSEGRYKHEGVKIGSISTATMEEITFSNWASRIHENFNRAYYIPLDPGDDSQHDIDPSIVHRRGIYKDLYKSSTPYQDYQLRPNFAVAIAIAPTLFPLKDALHALSVADNVLRGEVGMATLDPADLNYRPHYNNAEDSTDFATAKGRNYHQGPEWVWPLGYFLRALLRFEILRRSGLGEGWEEGKGDGRAEAFQLVSSRLNGCKRMIVDSRWKGLTELTDGGGAFCADSCPTQAWSASCLLDLYYDATQYQ